MSAAVGLDCFLRGARLAGSRPLRRFVWAPMATALAAVAVLLGFGYAVVGDVATWIVSLMPNWLSWLGAVVAALLYVIGLVLAGWLFSLLAVVAASPFLGVLSARAERAQFGEAPAYDESLSRAVANALAREVRKLRYHLPRLAAVFLLTLIPVVNVAAPLFWLGFGAWMLAVQFVDYAAENRGLDFGATVALLRANRAAALGFGVLAALLLAVPFAALVVIPAAVCGGGLLWRRLT